MSHWAKERVELFAHCLFLLSACCDWCIDSYFYERSSIMQLLGAREMSALSIVHSRSHAAGNKLSYELPMCIVQWCEWIINYFPLHGRRVSCSHTCKKTGDACRLLNHTQPTSDLSLCWFHSHSSTPVFSARAFALVRRFATQFFHHANSLWQMNNE